MMRWYAGDYPNPPVLVECPKPGWPNEDVEGRPQYANTHFDDERDVWENVRANVEAGVSIERRTVAQLTAALAAAKSRLVACIEELETFNEAYRGRYGSEVAGTQDGPKEI